MLSHSTRRLLRQLKSPAKTRALTTTIQAGDVNIFTEDDRSVTIKYDRDDRVKAVSIDQVPRTKLISDYSKVLTCPRSADFNEGWVFALDPQIAQWKKGTLRGVFAVQKVGSEEFLGSFNIAYIRNKFEYFGANDGMVLAIKYLLNGTGEYREYDRAIAQISKAYADSMTAFWNPFWSKPKPLGTVAIIHAGYQRFAEHMNKMANHSEPMLTSIGSETKKRLFFFHAIREPIISTKVAEVKSSPDDVFRIDSPSGC